jgi:hypothetical protein
MGAGTVGSLETHVEMETDTLKLSLHFEGNQSITLEWDEAIPEVVATFLDRALRPRGMSDYARNAFWFRGIGQLLVSVDDGDHHYIKREAKGWRVKDTVYPDTLALLKGLVSPSPT